jgi:uncharacterized SAM-binding protein YcdF (DUF218 family)
VSESKASFRPVGRRLQAAAIVVAIVAVALISHRLWLPAIGRFLVVNDPLQRSDAIIVLGGGGRHRMAAGAELFHLGYAPWLIVTNSPLNMPGIRVEYAELMRNEALWQGVPDESILTAPGTVRTTFQEAQAVRQLAEGRGLRSLIVVTDPFHTRRARRAFREAFAGSAIAIWAHPADGGWYDAESWWQSQDTLRETWTEYLKWVLYLFGHR